MIPPADLRDVRSTLGRLFMYSKDSLVSAHENFTTEAVAACIRADPQPMLAALAELADEKPSLTTRVAQATWIRVHTQVFLPNGGFLDMLLTLSNENGVIGEVWVEVKIKSPEGVGQMTGYAKAACALTRADGVSRDVVALSKARLHPDFPWLDWRQLYVAASRSQNPGWRDLRSFIGSRRVCGSFMRAVSSATLRQAQPRRSPRGRRCRRHVFLVRYSRRSRATGLASGSALSRQIGRLVPATRPATIEIAPVVMAPTWQIRAGKMRSRHVSNRRREMHWEAARRKFRLEGDEVYEDDDATRFAEERRCSSNSKTSGSSD